jgi:hypothetical protein
VNDNNRHPASPSQPGGLAARFSQFPAKATVARLREIYTPGRRVELVSMNDPYTNLKPGDQGSVDFVDDAGTVFVNWDSGSGLGAVYGEDVIKSCETL